MFCNGCRKFWKKIPRWTKILHFCQNMMIIKTGEICVCGFVFELLIIGLSLLIVSHERETCTVAGAWTSAVTRRGWCIVFFFYNFIKDPSNRSLHNGIAQHCKLLRLLPGKWILSCRRLRHCQSLTSRWDSCHLPASSSTSPLFSTPLTRIASN